jgi:membrane associated rhomboid family serine protease
MASARSGKFLESLKVVGGLVAVFWIVEIADAALFRGRLDMFGIRPRRLDGLAGIFLAPFLHGGFLHLIANTMPFLILGGLIHWRKPKDFVPVTVLSALIGGAGTWLFGAPGSVHVGASGIIFGFFGFLVARAYYERSFVSILTAFVVLFLYGGIIWGVRPFQSGISWQGHLFGLLGGIFAASLKKKS